MKLKEYLKETIGTIAFWISPKGQVYGGSTEKHINMIMQSPKKFGYSEEEIDRIYQKYDEPKGVEGKAREEIVRNVILKGFIRIRRYVNKFYSINAANWDSKTKDHLFGWALDMITGKNGVKETDKYMSVKITTDRGQPPRNITIGELASGDHMDEAKNREDVELYFVDSLDFFDDMRI